MPEENEGNHEEQARHEENEVKYKERMTAVRENIEKIFDTSMQEQKSPVDVFFEESRIEEAKTIFGSERIDEFIDSVRHLEIESKEAFVDAIMGLIEPLVHDRYFNSEIRSRAEEFELRHQPEKLLLSTLDLSVHFSPWIFEISDGTKITTSDRVMEIQWPDSGKQSKGVQGIKWAFRDIADLLLKHPDVKAVIGVSWMMSRGAVARLGFEKIPQATIDQEQKQSIIGLATKAREDKDYSKGVGEGDILLGAMSR